MPLTLPPTLPKEVRQRARQMFEQGVRIADISRQLSVNVGTLYQWCSRGEWQKPKPQTIVVPVRVVKDEPKNLHSLAVKSSLARVLEKQAAALDSETARVSEMRNGRAQQGLAAVAKTIAETAQIVFGWKADERPGVLILAGDLPQPEHAALPEPSKESLIQPSPEPKDP